MSTEVARAAELTEAFTEFVSDLTVLGKRVEILRIERGVSKQRLARHAGTSRQQLWRVMTGKSELTTSLRGRLAKALGVEPSALSPLTPSQHVERPMHAQLPGIGILPSPSPTMSDYLDDPSYVTASLRMLPSGDGGRRLKRALLNTVEDLALEAGRALSGDFSEIRRRVMAGEL